MFGYMTVYCKQEQTSVCESGQPNKIAYYTGGENGIYQVISEATHNGAWYPYVTTELSETRYYPNSFLMLADQDGSKSCKNAAECERILAALSQNKSFLVGGKFYKNLSDFINGNYERKRIYTVEEAEMLSKPTGNRFKIRYK